MNMTPEQFIPLIYCAIIAVWFVCLVKSVKREDTIGVIIAVGGILFNFALMTSSLQETKLIKIEQHLVHIEAQHPTSQPSNP